LVHVFFHFHFSANFALTHSKLSPPVRFPPVFRVSWSGFSPLVCRGTPFFFQRFCSLRPARFFWLTSKFPRPRTPNRFFFFSMLLTRFHFNAPPRLGYVDLLPCSPMASTSGASITPFFSFCLLPPFALPSFPHRGLKIPPCLLRNVPEGFFLRFSASLSRGTGAFNNHSLSRLVFDKSEQPFPLSGEKNTNYDSKRPDPASPSPCYLRSFFPFFLSFFYY